MMSDDELPELPYTAIGGRPRERTPSRSPSVSPARRSTPRRSASQAVYSQEGSPFKRTEEEGEAEGGGTEGDEEGEEKGEGDEEKGEEGEFKAPDENESDEEEQDKKEEAFKKQNAKNDLWQTKQKEDRMFENNLTKTDDMYICNNNQCNFRTSILQPMKAKTHAIGSCMNRDAKKVKRKAVVVLKPCTELGCDEEFPSKAKRRKHYQLIHKDPQLLHTCWKCSETFHELNAFKRHSRKHTDRHICTDCDRVMSSKERLTTHKAAIHGVGADPNAEIKKREKITIIFDKLKAERLKNPNKWEKLVTQVENLGEKDIGLAK